MHIGFLFTVRFTVIQANENFRITAPVVLVFLGTTARNKLLVYFSLFFEETDNWNILLSFQMNPLYRRNKFKVRLWRETYSWLAPVDQFKFCFPKNYSFLRLLSIIICEHFWNYVPINYVMKFFTYKMIALLSFDPYLCPWISCQGNLLPALLMKYSSVLFTKKYR